jgi:ankyrin repeat protein
MSILEAAISEDLEALKANLSSGNIDEQDEETGFTALHVCAQNGNAEMTKILLENGASVNIKDNYGNTALFKAVFFSNGKTEIIKMLIDSGSNPEDKNDAGMTPRRLAENMAAFDVTEVFK